MNITQFLQAAKQHDLETRNDDLSAELLQFITVKLKSTSPFQYKELVDEFNALAPDVYAAREINSDHFVEPIQWI